MIVRVKVRVNCEIKSETGKCIEVWLGTIEDSVMLGLLGLSIRF